MIDRKQILRLGLFLIVCSAVVGKGIAQAPQKSFVEGEILVKFRQGVTNGLRSEALDLVGGELVESLGSGEWSRVKIVNGQSVESSIRSAVKNRLIEAAQPNFYYYLQATPNDALFPNAGMYGMTKISAPAAWDLSTGSSTVVVANIDTGIRYTHEDLAANMWMNTGEVAGNGIDDEGNGFVDDVYGYDFRFNDADPLDQHGHGTHTAGTIGAVGNNSVGVAGVNWNVKIMAIKIYSATGNDTTSAMLVNAYNYVLLMKNRGVNIRVTNNSYGGCNEACGYDQATKDAIDALGDAGILNVFAAGNSGVNIETTPFYPASYTSPSILSVAASDQSDNRFFNWGAVSVDLAAPGISILSTTNGSNSSYGSMSGTSMATPHVAGAAALLAARHPSLSAVSLKATLMNSVDVLPQWQGLVKTGGRLNVSAALQNPTVCDPGFGVSEIVLPTKGGQVNLNVNTLANCDYRVRSDRNWIVVNGQSLLTNGGQLKFWVRVNPKRSRIGTVMVGDKAIAVKQQRP